MSFEALKAKRFTEKREFSHHWEEYGFVAPDEQDVKNIDNFQFAGVNKTFRVYTDEKGSFHYPSVTTMLGKVAEIDSNGVDMWAGWKARVGEEEAARILTEAGELGTAMHDCAEKYLMNQEVPKDHSRGYQLFKVLQPALNNIEGVVFCEHALWSHTLKLAGRIDNFALAYEGIPEVVVDFKTSRSAKEDKDIFGYKIQTSTYGMMIEDQTGIRPEMATILMVVWNDKKRGCQPYLKTFDVFLSQYREQALDMIGQFHDHYKFFPDFDLNSAKEKFL